MTQVATKKSRLNLKKPKNFEAILLNDDYTTMEFVIEVLKRFFNKDALAAETIMLIIHTEGEAVCGTYPYDIAQSKVSQVIEYSRNNEQPLMCVLRELNF